MKLLRAGGGYLTSETHRHGLKRLWIVGLGVCAAVIVGLAWHPLVSLVPLFIAASQARPVHRKVKRVQRGLRGEESITGEIACKAGRWSVNSRPIKSPSKQVDRGALAVKKYLCEEHPHLSSTAALRWVDSVLVFTDPLCRLELDRPGVTTARFSELLGVIHEKAKQNRLSPTIAATLAYSLRRQGRVHDIPA